MIRARKRGSRYNWFDVSAEKRPDWQALCKPGEYAVLPSGHKLPPIIPSELVTKAESVLVMAAGSDAGICYYMANILRVDIKAMAIDQNPFGLAFIGDAPAPSGVLVQHGSWPGRTISPPREFWDYVTASRIGNHYPISEMPIRDRGKIEDLRIDSQHNAFETILVQLKRFTERED